MNTRVYINIIIIKYRQAHCNISDGPGLNPQSGMSVSIITSDPDYSFKSFQYRIDI